ncbi:hypothetical protein MWU77_03445 [Rhodococcus sp. F64268]|uniref:hypothetical protein n=1 Tax=Rhodococcus sp. F64268 TaxID=2926402 RepID=UPI001FF1ECA7|nr:hypothetical protein [Rhodococcus sp. F64268]MCK0089833.1 hypothetical protein [Rhodococcus sp. F64268]
MFTADRFRTVTLPPLVLGGLRPLHRQMIRSNVASASFEHDAGGAVFGICLTEGQHGPELLVRSRSHGIAFTLAMTTHFRVAPVLSDDTYRRLCEILAPGEEPSPDVVAGFLQSVVAQSPAVLSRTHSCAA